ncbi:choice-of-anchor L domain-containing protein [Salinimicrobium sp. GXAS 041]|uniref:T9SS type B sorting domain-containing protein n=1 Tax=Salinimicrobium sp. GXAS 041 TaxID=3400806 RepID=UPI003C71D6EE
MKWIKYLLFFVCTITFGQQVKIDDTGNEPSDFVNELLDNACVQVSNSSISSEESVALFKDEGGNFPISEGVIIRSGKAKYSEGSYTGANLSSQINSNTDAALEQLNSRSGQSPQITDVAFLEFDFVPLSSDFSFNFLFASNEYGEWQCVSSDVFAFLLTDLTTGQTTNLAVVPGTDTPVSVRNIKDNTFNASCESDFPELFSSYHVDDPSGSAINMRGYTKLLNASAEINPGKPYRIRLVIGDSNDGKYDSAIFLEAGSFSANVDLGEDRDFCFGDSDVISTGLDTQLYAHAWTLNGKEILGETTNSLTVTEAGTYGVKVTQNSTSCLATDEVVFNDLMLNQPKDLIVCAGENVYDLTTNNTQSLGLNPWEYQITYYASFTNMRMDRPIKDFRLTEYESAGDEQIYFKLTNIASGNTCAAEYSFKLLVNEAVQALKPEPVAACFVPNRTSEVDLTQTETAILGNQDPAAYEVRYFSSAEDAAQGIHALQKPWEYRLQKGEKRKTLWARVDDLNMPQCFATVSFDVVLNDPPPVDELEDVVECVKYILPEITHGNYFTGAGGSGKALFAGDVITETGVYYIFNGPDDNGCTNDSNFKVTIIESYGIAEKYCGQFAVPTPPEGAFYTQPGGPEGNGTELLPGTLLFNDQQIYYYAEVNEQLCRDEAFNIVILELPPVDQPAHVVTCNSYVLPALTHGDYFTQPNGKGKKLQAGERISASTTLYVFSKNTICTNQHEFDITITPAFTDVEICGSYEIPQVDVGGFYTAANGLGKEIPPGTVISETQEIHYYVKTTTSECSGNSSFEVKILPIPEVSSLEDVLLCEEEIFVLPEITNGEYFTQPGRTGEKLLAGAVIDSSATIYINNFKNTCSIESSFEVEIRPFPTVENFTDIYTCSTYELPQLKHGKYFTKPGGKGIQLQGGEIIDSTRTLYVYNSWEDLQSCTAENAFTIYVEGIDVGDFEDVKVCDAYVLPKLSGGNYFTKPGGKGTKLKAGDKITETSRIYVYSSNGTRFICEDENSFEVTVSKTPDLPVFPDVESCGSYTLPALSNAEYNVHYYRQRDGKSRISASEMTFSEPGNYTVYVYATAKNNQECINEREINITVYPLLELAIPEATLCRNPETGEVESKALLSSGLAPNEFEVTWYFNGKPVHTGADYAASEAGEYTVKTTKLQPEKGALCNYSPATVKVWESAQPIITADVTAPFEEIAVINVKIDKGFGEYEYSLDGGEFQLDNEFYDVASGVHEIRVRGLTGNCGMTRLEVVVLKFPEFFTPNEDGFNETWTIPDLLNHPEARISLFDRYGQLLKVFPPTQSWDGTFNGRNMPSDDYWFRVSFEHDGVAHDFKSHFTLMR